MILLEDRRTIWVVATLIILLFAIANLPWQLDDYDQAKQAFTSFEMVKEGHWLYQHTPHERVATKPPLVGWISAAIFAVTRSWEIAWRLPSLFAALALALVLFRAARDGVWKRGRGNRSKRLWTEPAESEIGYARANRHAAGTRDFSHRPSDLAKNPKGRGMETARSGLPLRSAHGGDVDQGSDPLCLSATGHRAVPIVPWSVPTARRAENQGELALGRDGGRGLPRSRFFSSGYSEAFGFSQDFTRRL